MFETMIKKQEEIENLKAQVKELQEVERLQEEVITLQAAKIEILEQIKAKYEEAQKK